MSWLFLCRKEWVGNAERLLAIGLWLLADVNTVIDLCPGRSCGVQADFAIFGS